MNSTYNDSAVIWTNMVQYVGSKGGMVFVFETQRPCYSALALYSSANKLQLSPRAFLSVRPCVDQHEKAPPAPQALKLLIRDHPITAGVISE